MMTTIEFGTLVSEVATWWTLSEPWKRSAAKNDDGRLTGRAGLYIEFQPYTLGAALEAVQTYRKTERADYCPTPNKLLELTRTAAKVRAAEGIDPAPPRPSCEGRHVWALATPTDRLLVEHPEDVCAVCDETRSASGCDHQWQHGVCVYCLEPADQEGVA